MELRIRWIRNPPAEPVYYDANTLTQAKNKLLALEEADNLDDKVYVNQGGLQVKNEKGAWQEWQDEERRDIWEVLKAED